MLLPAAAGAATGADAPTQLVGLFLQGCLRFAGHPAALRDWARGNRLAALPEQGRAAFLHGAPGQAFDASAAGIKLVLVSSDDGICSAVTDQARQQPLTDALEDGLRQAGLRFRLVIERDDKVFSAIHDREYLAAEGSHGWRILLAAVRGDRGGEAMLTAAPE
ncbi:NMCC_0638 family (lipo)protein [Rhodopila sp.]|uniref:NMCC_0638 family (lipo)protein n=1 Tax=Rhodopila sp. TaxID=2480087 RepID=UPI003D107796